MILVPSDFIERIRLDLQLEQHEVAPDSTPYLIGGDTRTDPERLDGILTSDAYARATISGIYAEFLGRPAEPDGVRAHIGHYREHGWHDRVQAVACSDECWNELGGSWARVYIGNLWSLLSGQASCPWLDPMVEQLDGGRDSRLGTVRALVARPEVSQHQARRLWTRLTGSLDDVPAEIANGPALREAAIRAICMHPAYAASLARPGRGLDQAAIALRGRAYRLLTGAPGPVGSQQSDLAHILDETRRESIKPWFMAVAHSGAAIERLIGALSSRFPQGDYAGFKADNSYYRLLGEGQLPPLRSDRLDHDMTAAAASAIVAACAEMMGLSEPDLPGWTARLLDFGSIAALAAEMAFAASNASMLRDAKPSGIVRLSAAPGPFVGRGFCDVPPASDRAVGVPTVATTYFYWYECIDGRTYLENPDKLPGHKNRLSLSLRPPTLEGFSHRNLGLHEREFLDMAEAGIDIALPVYFGSPYSAPEQPRSAVEANNNKDAGFSDRGLRSIVLARESLVRRGHKVPGLGLFHDTSSAFHNAKNWHIDARTLVGRSWLYEIWRNFFSQIPRHHWATIDGRPAVFVYHPAFIRHPTLDLYDHLSDQFEADFGVRPYIVTAAEQDAVQINDTSALTNLTASTQQGQSTEALIGILASDEVLRLAGGDAQLPDFLFSRLLERAPFAKERTSFLRRMKKDGRHAAVADLLASDTGRLGVMAYMARRWLRLAGPLHMLGAHPVIQAAVTAAGASGDLLDGYATILQSDAFYAAAGGRDEYFLDLFHRMTTHVFTDPKRRQPDLLTLQHAGRETFVRLRLREFTHAQGLMSHWFWYYLGRFSAGRADSEFYWSGAIDPMMHAVPSFGPGYDQSALEGRPLLIAPRENGRRYDAVWQNLLAMQPRPWLVHLETWNEFFEGSVICDTAEFGRKYIDQTRHYAAFFHGKTPWDPSMVTEPDIHKLAPVVRVNRTAELDVLPKIQEDEMSEELRREVKALAASVKDLLDGLKTAPPPAPAPAPALVAAALGAPMAAAIAQPANSLFPHSPLARGVVYEPDVYRSYEDSDVDLFTAFVDPGIRPVAGAFTDFLGRITNCRFLPSIQHLEGKASTELPVPGDGFYADAIEYVGLLLAYRTLRTGRFVSVELGAGWGPWTAASGVVGRKRGVPELHLIAMEASAGKIELMKQHLLDNRLRPDTTETETKLDGVHCRCVRGAIWTHDGEVHFPIVVAEQDYGGAVMENAGSTDYRGLESRYEAIPAYTLANLLRDEPVVDFMHIDIQGAEARICSHGIDFLREHVRYIFIGTHSRSIEGELVTLFRSNGFDILREKPCRFSFEAWSGSLEGITTADGGQLWRNQKFA